MQAAGLAFRAENQALVTSPQARHTTMSSICDRCEGIGLSREQFPRSDGTITLGKISKWTQSCPLCLTWLRLAGIEAFPEENEDEGEFDFEEEATYHIVPFNTSTLFEDPPTVALNSWDEPLSYSVAEEENIRNADGQQLFNCVRGRGWVSPLSLSVEEKDFSPRVLAPKVDVVLMKKLMSQCVNGHPACNSGSRRDMKPIRLVNCTTHEVILRTSEEPYLSLSYVNSAVQEDTTRHQKGTPLSLPLPRLYQDSIQLTRQLGYNYIWIDNYCIPQEDSRSPLTEDERVERKIQIRQMDQIYTRSDLTIIAAHGLPILPGISPREPSTTVEIQGETYVISSPTPAYEIENSDSNERSWCYQEATLATRRLVLLNRQAYFKCKTAHAVESLHGEIRPWNNEHGGKYDLHRWNEFEIFANISAQKADPLDHIYNHLAEYTKRRLTRDKDILLAVAGVMAQLKATYPDLITVSGVPVVSRRLGEKTRFIDRFVTGLCWKTAFDCERRPNFPSWSWAVWYLPGMVEGRPDTFQAKGGTLPYLDPGEESLSAMKGLEVSLCETGSAEVILVDEALPRRLRDLDAELTFVPDALIVEAMVLDVRFERWLYDLPGDTQSPKGHASFATTASKATFRARLFPPDDRFRAGEDWTLVTLGTGHSKGVMLIVKRVSEGMWERIGVVDLEQVVGKRIRTAFEKRRLKVK